MRNETIERTFGKQKENYMIKQCPTHKVNVYHEGVTRDYEAFGNINFCSVCGGPLEVKTTWD